MKSIGEVTMNTFSRLLEDKLKYEKEIEQMS